MRYALNDNGSKIEVTSSGEIGICPGCGSEVVGRFGMVNEKHWSHKAKNCDNWYEPITEWHLSWQNIFPEKYREISLKSSTGEIHIADIQLKNKLVIEVQNSSIKIDEIISRENFYGKNNMIWILNGETLTKKSKIISYQFHKKKFLLRFEIPNYSTKIKEYDLDEFRSALFKNSVIKELNNSPYLINSNVNNGCFFNYEFSKSMSFFELEIELQYLFRSTCQKLYGYDAFNELKLNFSSSHIDNSRNHYTNVILEQKNWRKFINFMNYPVLIDNLEGLTSDLLYWYQKNRIVKRSDFITKYLNYT